MLTERQFAESYSAYHSRVLSLCRYLLNSVDAAEDAAHEVFLRAQRGFSTYKTDLPFGRWIMGIASHYCVDLLRRRSTETRLFGTQQNEPASGGLSPLNAVLMAERGEDVRAALAKLPDKHRIPLVMAYYNEWSYDEISETLGLHRNHVATLIYRGKQQLREALAHHAHHEAKGAKK